VHVAFERFEHGVGIPVHGVVPEDQTQPNWDEQLVESVRALHGESAPTQLVALDHKQPLCDEQLVESVNWLHCVTVPVHVLDQWQPIWALQVDSVVRVLQREGAPEQVEGDVQVQPWAVHSAEVVPLRLLHVPGVPVQVNGVRVQPTHELHASPHRSQEGCIVIPVQLGAPPAAVHPLH
jgi:hypothetical protein